MKILHVLDRSVPNMSGYASRSYYIVKSQRHLGLTPIVLTSPSQPSAAAVEEIEGVRYHRFVEPQSPAFLKIPGLSLLAGFRRLRRKIEELIEQEGVDCIHAHSPAILGLAALYARGARPLKVIYEIRAFWEDAAVASNKYRENGVLYRSVRALETTVCRKADRVVTIAAGLRNDLLKRGLPPGSVTVVPNGVDHQQFHPVPRDAALCRRFGITDDSVVVGYVGTFFDFEGVQDLVSAMADLIPRHENLFFLLVGGGEQEQAISARMSFAGDSRMQYVGKVPHKEVLSYYSLIDIFAYPRKSRRVTELTTPLKPLEAMAQAKPVICSDVMGLRELVGDGNGLFFPAGDVEALKESILRLYLNQDLRRDLGRRGREMTIAVRGWQDIVRKSLEIYGAADNSGVTACLRFKDGG